MALIKSVIKRQQRFDFVANSALIQLSVRINNQTLNISSFNAFNSLIKSSKSETKTRLYRINLNNNKVQFQLAAGQMEVAVVTTQLRGFGRCPANVYMLLESTLVPLVLLTLTETLICFLTLGHFGSSRRRQHK